MPNLHKVLDNALAAQDIEARRTKLDSQKVMVVAGSAASGSVASASSIPPPATMVVAAASGSAASASSIPPPATAVVVLGSAANAPPPPSWPPPPLQAGQYQFGRDVGVIEAPPPGTDLSAAPIVILVPGAGGYYAKKG